MKAKGFYSIGRIVEEKGSLMVKPLHFDPEPQLLKLHPESGPGNVSLSAGDIISYEVTGSALEGRVFKHLAEAGSARAILYTIAEEMKISFNYPDDVLTETEYILNNPAVDDPLIKDLRNHPFTTIDNPGSRDLDQALFIEKTGSNYSIFYALADAAYYVKPGSGLFREALKRGVTYYFPDFSVPMLPPVLSEGLLSLNPDVDRRALVFKMTMNRAGEITECRVFQGLIHSRAQLTYEGVQEYYDHPQNSPLSDRDFSASLDMLKEVGELCIKNSRQSNRVQFRREEALVSCSKDGSSFEISMDTRNDCSRYNEQISLMCNTMGAHFLRENSGPRMQGIFRVHATPCSDDLDHLCQTINEIVSGHEIKDSALSWDRKKEPVGDYLDRIYEMKDYPRITEAIERQVLITMRRSLYSPGPGMHFALGVNPYSRFSSPMREIVGIFTHKEALEIIGDLQSAPAETDELLREQVIEAGNKSREVQRDIERQVIKAAADRLFHHELDMKEEERTLYSATVLGIKKTRLYVRLDSPPIELKVYTEDLEKRMGGALEFKKNTLVCTETGEVAMRPGDELILRVDSYRDHRWRLLPVE